MKGLSNLMTLILLVSITSFSLSMVFAYYSGIFNSITSVDSDSGLADVMSSCIKIESAKNSSIFLRNCGSGVVRSEYVSVIVDDLSIGFSMTPAVIGDDQIANITISLVSLDYGSRKVVITTKAARTERYVNITDYFGTKVMSLLDLV
jgi:hypothetical protein